MPFLHKESMAVRLDSRSYCLHTDMTKLGALQLRPWQLPFRQDYGLRGTADVEACTEPMFSFLYDAILCHFMPKLRMISINCVNYMVIGGFLTNPNTPGCEKVCVCKVESSWLMAPTHGMLGADVVLASEHSGLAGPENFFMVKGWSRAVVCLSVLAMTGGICLRWDLVQ